MAAEGGREIGVVGRAGIGQRDGDCCVLFVEDTSLQMSRMMHLHLDERSSGSSLSWRCHRHAIGDVTCSHVGHRDGAVTRFSL